MRYASLCITIMLYCEDLLYLKKKVEKNLKPFPALATLAHNYARALSRVEYMHGGVVDSDADADADVDADIDASGRKWKCIPP